MKRQDAMFIGRLILCFSLWIPAACVAQTGETTEERDDPAAVATPIVSSSGQFFIFASDHNWAVWLSRYVETVKSFVLRRVQTHGAWRDPILVIAHDEKSPSALRGTVQLSVKPVTAAQTYYVLNCYEPAESQRLLEGIIEAVTLELVHRAGQWDPRVKWVARPPLWWVQGIAESLREDWRDANQQLLARAWSANAPAHALTLVAATTLPEDPLERRYFQAQCGLLMRALTAAHDGRAMVSEYLSQAGRGADSVGSFRCAAIKQFADDRALEKWWALECAAHAMLLRVGVLTIPATAAALDELLVFETVAAEADDDNSTRLRLKLEEIPPHRKKPEVRWRLRENAANLRLLATHAHPLYRSVIESFAAAMEQIEQGDVTGFRSSLRKAQSLRAAADAYISAVDEWVGEVESSLTPPLERLGPYLQELEKLRELERMRTDRIKDYLDDAEKELSR